jgi:putative endonuclease
MPFDFQTDAVGANVPNHAAGPVGDARRTNYHAGVSAEQAVARHYQDRGAVLREIRWRGRCGEIDLILSEGDNVVFVEVKKSCTHAAAVQRVTARQLGRILRSAEDYLGQCPAGALTDARLDVALVDAQGRIDIIPNASMGL